VQQTEKMLRDIPARVAQLRDLDADISELEHPGPCRVSPVCQ
jgi:hypothetical protein